MQALNRKLIRDVVHLRGQLIAVALVVTFGVASYVTMRSVYGSLLVTKNTYYSQYRFADVFANLIRAPESIADDIRDIPGVASVQTRVTVPVTLDVPGLPEPATGLMISVPPERELILNDLFIRSGRYIEAGREGELIISEAFAEANNLKPGAIIGAVINGRRQKFTVVGIALSPEYVYEMNGVGSLFPDNKRFGILWVGQDILSAAYDMEGAFNNLALTLAHGANEQFVIDHVDNLTERFGGLGAYGRSSQLSDTFLSGELDQLSVSGMITPAIFLAVAVFLLHIVLTRLVGTQRDQVAILKAFGYTNITIGLHFLGIAMVAILVGGIAGIGLGMWAGSAITEVYRQFFHFPIIRYVAGFDSIGIAILISSGSALAGAIAAVRKAVALPPAEAMRPEPPARYRPGPLEWLGVNHLFSTGGRMVLRSLERNPGKAFLSVFGIALAIAILVVGRYSSDAITEMINLTFNEAQREDVTVVFNKTLSAQACFNLASLPGVLRVEPFRSVAATLVNGNRERRIGITGMEPGSDLHRIIGEGTVVIQIPTEGILLSAELGKRLGVAPGDILSVQILEGERALKQVQVAGLVEDVLGLSAYMNIRALNDVMLESPVISGAYLSVDSKETDKLYTTLKNMPAIAGVSIQEVTVKGFNETIAENQKISRNVLIIAACVIAIGVIYNSARIALSERGRELASLRVLGFTRGEVARMLLGEQAALTIVALPFGFLLGQMMVAGMSESVDPELYRLPMVIGPETYAFATVVVAIAAILSALLVRRRIFNLDLVEVLKTRE